MNEASKVTYLKRKLEDVTDETEDRLKKICKLDYRVDISPVSEILSELNKFKDVMTQFKEKFASGNHQEKIQILTIFVNTFSNTYLIENFDTTRRMVESAIKVKEQGGILSLPRPRQGRQLNADIKNRILEYYSNPDFGQVRMLPGKNDFVSMKKMNMLRKG